VANPASGTVTRIATSMVWTAPTEAPGPVPSRYSPRVTTTYPVLPVRPNLNRFAVEAVSPVRSLPAVIWILLVVTKGSGE